MYLFNMFEILQLELSFEMLIFKTCISNEKPVEFYFKKYCKKILYSAMSSKTKKVNLLPCYDQPVIKLTIFVETFMQTINRHHLCHCALFLYTNKNVYNMASFRHFFSLLKFLGDELQDRSLIFCVFKVE